MRGLVVKRRLASKSEGPSLEPGKAFRLNARGGWDVTDVPPDAIRKSKFSGYLQIEGIDSAVFDGPDGVSWAQRVPPAGLNVSSRLIASALRIAGPMSGTWVPPSLEEEDEALVRLADEEGLDMPSLLRAARSAKMRALSESDWRRLERTDSYGVDSVSDATHIAESYGRDVDSVIRGFAQGASIPAPVVLERPDGSITLVCGNARLMAARALGLSPQVLWVTSPL